MVAALADLEIAIVPGGEFQTTLGDEVDEGALCRRRGVVDGVDDLLILMRAGDGEHLGEAGADDVGFAAHAAGDDDARSEENTSELQSLMRTSYAVFCLNKNKKERITTR